MQEEQAVQELKPAQAPARTLVRQASWAPAGRMSRWPSVRLLQGVGQVLEAPGLVPLDKAQPLH